jgi:hypothetical protein
MTTVEVFRGGSFEAIDYSDFTIDLGIGEQLIAPEAEIEVNPREDILANQDVRIVENGTTLFSGYAVSGGTKRRGSTMTVKCEHPAVKLFEATVSLTLAGPLSDGQVLQNAETNADVAESFTINYIPTEVSLNQAYECTDRPVKKVFRDMMDRAARVWWVDPASNTITVNDRGGRGQWQALDGSDRGVTLAEYDPGDVDTVRNDVTVVGTGAEAVRGSAENSASISAYGRRTGESPYQVAYITTQAEADAAADALLQTDPVPEAQLQVARNVGDIAAPLVNYTVEITDDSFDIGPINLDITRQSINQGAQGQATLWIGGGEGASLAEYNRAQKSKGDTTDPGSVYGNARLADSSVDSDQLVDASVIEDKLDDLAVSLQKVQDGAISETKVTDDAISTPKLQAEAVTAAEILADTITANEITAGTITALEIAADTLTANEIDVLDLDAGELSVSSTTTNATLSFETFTDPNLNTVLSIIPTGADESWLGSDSNLFTNVTSEAGDFGTLEPFQGDNQGNVGTAVAAWSQMWAYEYIDADTGSAINDGGDILAGLSRGQGPPEHARAYDDEGTQQGVKINELTKTVWEICTAQQERIEELEERISRLEESL